MIYRMSSRDLYLRLLFVNRAYTRTMGRVAMGWSAFWMMNVGTYGRGRESLVLPTLQWKRAE